MMLKSDLRILIACEESQTVAKAFRDAGFTAFSNDIVDSSGGYPEWHIKGDAIEQAYSGKWDMMIAHPPCTHLAVSGVSWFTRGIKPYSLQHNALYFVFQLLAAPIAHIALENPVSVISSKITKPSQIVQPYMFGHPVRKTTCLWLNGLPLLVPTNDVKSQVPEGRKGNPLDMLPPSKDRARLRSKTYTGLAEAMAQQWGDYLIAEYGLL